MRTLRMTVCALVLFASALSLTPLAVGAGEGSVNGAAETPFIKKIEDCLRLEREALDIMSVNEPEAARYSIREAADCLGAVITELAAAPKEGFQESTDVVAAIRLLDRAAKLDVKAGATTNAQQSKFIKKVGKSNAAKAEAILALKGQVSVDSGAVTYVAAYQGPDLYFESFDKAGRKNEQRNGWKPDEEGVILFLRALRLVPVDTSAGGKRVSYGRYLALRAKKRKSTTPAFGFMSTQRDLTGPFRAEITAGVFDERDENLAAQGEAFACMELDVTGSSSPLEYVAACARYTNGGILAFANRTGQVALGQQHFPGVKRVRLRIDYDAVTLRVYAKPEGAADDAFVSIGQFDRPQGSDTWVAGLGAARLLGRAQVGLDDLALSVLEQQ